MIVCHCHGVTDRDIRKSVEAGKPACEAVRRACQAGTGCGGCVPQIEMVLRGVRKGQPSAPGQAAAG